MDQIPAKCLMGSAEVLAFPLRNVINLSIKLSTFPEDCKVAKLKPILKKRCKNGSQKLPTYFTFTTNVKNTWKINSLSSWRLR